MSGGAHTTETPGAEYAGFYRARRVLVTGGAGFIGSHLVRALVDLQADVTVLDDLSSSDTKHLAPLIDRHPDRVRLVYGSLLDPTSLSDGLDGRQTVFHLAAIGSVPRSLEDPQRTFEVNAVGTLRVMDHGRQMGVERVVLASSSSVYGMPADRPADEPKRETDPLDPLSPYAASKMSAEAVVSGHARSYDIDGVSLRYFNVFGPHQRAGGPYAAVVPAFVGALRRGKGARIFGDGSYSRDFTAVDNAVHANLLAGARRQAFGGLAINVGAGVRTTIRELHDRIAAVMGAEGAEPVHEEARTGDVPHSLADLSRARAELGYEARVSLDEGLSGLLGDDAAAQASGERR
jgi:nucleoside-diphosphate-sugar epimerase